jgi:hypothetical protein
MTISAILLPNWISFHSSLSPLDDLYIEYGLHQACSSLTSSCRPFPEPQDCQDSNGRYFCSLWRTTGFLMNLAAVLEFVTIVAYIVVLAGGKQKRRAGWKLLSIILLVTGMVQCAAMAIVASLTLYDTVPYGLLLTGDRRTLMTMITGFSLAGG